MFFWQPLAAFSADARPGGGGRVPADIQAVFNKPLYKKATWGVRVVDPSGKVLIDYNSHYRPLPAILLRLYRAQSPRQLGVANTLVTGAPGSNNTLKVDPEFPSASDSPAARSVQAAPE